MCVRNSMQCSMLDSCDRCEMFDDRNTNYNIDVMMMMRMMRVMMMMCSKFQCSMLDTSDRC